MGTPGAQCEQGDAVAWSLQPSRRAAGPLRKDEQDTTCIEDPLGDSERLDIGAAAVHRMDRTGPKERTEERPLEHLALAEPVHPPAEGRRQPAADQGAVGVREVVGGDDEPAGLRDRVEGTFDADPGDAAEDRPGTESHARDERREGVLDDRLAVVGPVATHRVALAAAAVRSASAALIDATTRATVWSNVAPSVCSTVASAGIRKGATSRPPSIASRARSASRIA